MRYSSLSRDTSFIFMLTFLHELGINVIHVIVSACRAVSLT